MSPRLFFLTSFLLFISSGIAFSQGDSLVKFADLSFKTTEEGPAFQKFISTNNTDNIIDLLLVPFEKENTANSKEVHKKIEDCVALMKEQTEGKTDVKKVKFIYDYVHRSFFKMYKLRNSFADIFNKGEYNCVSASAFYAIIFSKMGIPFQIMETPNHIYLVAYPQTSKVLIESTTPEKGYYQFNDNFVEKYVKYLSDTKQITKEEYLNTTADSLFRKYYFASGGVSLKQLSGLQYSNYGLYDIEDKKYEEAIAEIKKAYVLYPGDRHKYLLKSTLVYEVSNNDYKDAKQVDNLVMLCRYTNEKDNESGTDQIRTEFSRITQTQLINNSDYEKFDASYAKINEAIKDTTLKKNISFDYHYELARLGYLNSKSQDYEMPHLQAAYAINPLNANLQTLVLACFERTAQKLDDVEAISNLIVFYSSKFDFVNDNSLFNGVRANCILQRAYQHFFLNEISKGESSLKEFEDLCKTKKDVTANAGFVERAYSTGAAIYYKKGNLAKAKQMLKTGLIYAPDSFGLKQRLSQF